jgi:3-hydroxyacyl-CoA dehydrogenase
VGKNFVDSFPERVYVSRIFTLMVEAKRLGEKSGAGFYKVCVAAAALLGRGKGVATLGAWAASCVTAELSHGVWSELLLPAQHRCSLAVCNVVLVLSAAV